MTTPIVIITDHNKFSSLSNTAVVVIFQISVNGNVVYAQKWEVLTLKNPIKPVNTDTMACPIGVRINRVPLYCNTCRQEHLCKGH